MEDLIISPFGGGFFSLYHVSLVTIFVEYRDMIDNINSFQIIVPEKNFDNKNIINNVFYYDNSSILSRKQTYLQSDCTCISNSLFYRSTQYKTDDIDILKKIIHKNKIHHNITNYVNDFAKYFNITSRTLTVHIRLTDMNVMHAPDYGTLSFEDYINEIDNTLKMYPEIDSLFIASDNNESVNKILALYNEKIKVIVFNNVYRFPTENSSDFNIIKEMANKHQDYAQTLLSEVLVASKGGYFIGRVSSVSFFIILYSDTIKYIKYLN